MPDQNIPLTNPLYLALFLVVTLLSSLLPFVLRFGFSGLLIFLISLQLLGVLLLGITTMASRNGGARFSLREWLSGLNQAIGMLQGTLGDPFFYLAMTGALGLLLMTSVRISIRILERREF